MRIFVVLFRSITFQSYLVLECIPPSFYKSNACRINSNIIYAYNKHVCMFGLLINCFYYQRDREKAIYDNFFNTLI